MIPGFATRTECASLVGQSNKLGFHPYQYVDPPIDRIGVTVFEYDKIGMASYFREAEIARRLQREIFASSFDPLARFISTVGANHPGSVGIATDSRMGQYYAGLVRRIEAGTMLHIDFASAEQPDWQVASVRSQLAWNLYVDLDETGAGSTHVYNRPWTSALERFKIPDSYGYRHELLEGSQHFTYRPTLGDVLIFNTRNFHEVDRSNGNRVTVTSAMGLFDDGALKLWS